jgi:putative redox protein
MYRVEISSAGESAFKVKSKDYEFMINTKGKGMSPPDTLLASLGSCIGVYLRKYAEGAKLNLPDFSIKVEAEFTKEPPFCFKEIKALVDLKGLELEARRKMALLEFIKNCPVHNTLAAQPHIEIKIF